MMIPEHEIFVHYIDHLGNNEAVTINEDGSYSIFLDPALSYEMQHEKYEHALRHIQNHDFEKENVQEIEAQAHNIVAPAVVPIAQNSTQTPRPARKRRRRTSTSTRQWKECEERVAFMSKYDRDYAFKQGENRWLYGGL